MTASPPAAPGMPSEEEILRAINVGWRDGDEFDNPAALLAILSLIRPALEAKDAEIVEWQRQAVEARSRLRWNIDDEGRLVRLCEGDHEKSEDCEYTTYVPESELRSAEAKLAQAVEENERLQRQLSASRDDASRLRWPDTTGQ